MKTDHNVKLEQQESFTSDTSILESSSVSTSDQEFEEDDEDFDQFLSPPPCAFTMKPFLIKTEQFEMSLKSEVLNQQEMDEEEEEKEIIQATPDINDPNYFCKVCQHTYASKSSYRRHLKNIHQISLPIKKKLSKPPPVQKNNPAWYCNDCLEFYGTKKTFVQHMKRVHCVFLQEAHTKKKVRDLTNFYCQLCKKQTTSEAFFSIHLASNGHHQRKRRKEEKATAAIHRIAQKDINQVPIGFSVNLDPTNSCCHDCNQSFIWNFLYRRHLNTVHHMDLQIDEPKEVPLSVAATAENVNDGGGSNECAADSATTAIPSKFDQIERTYHCVTCCMTFPKKTDYWNHLDMRHLNGSKYGIHL